MNFKIFEKFPELRYGISDKKDGFMNANITDDKKRHFIAENNRARFFKNNDIQGKIFVPELRHGSEVAIIGKKNYQSRIKADGFITATPGIFLTITVADCFPVYFYDPIKKVICLAHCGWRGIAKNIAKNVVAVFEKFFLSEPADILMTIGPGIQKCHFSVKEDVVGNFKEYDEFIKRSGEFYFIDLSGIISRQAKDEGIVNVGLSKQCTYCDFNKYFSYRRDKSSFLKTMLAYIDVAPNAKHYNPLA